MGWNDLAARLTSTDAEKAARNALHVMRKILTGEVQEAERHDVGPSEQADCRLSRPRSRSGWIDHRWRSEIQIDSCLQAICGRGGGRNSPKFGQHELPRGGIYRSHGSAQHGLTGNHIRCVPGLN